MSRQVIQQGDLLRRARALLDEWLEDVPKGNLYALAEDLYEALAAADSRPAEPPDLIRETWHNGYRQGQKDADSRPGELTELAAEIAKSWTPHRHDPKSCGDCLALVAADSRPAELDVERLARAIDAADANTWDLGGSAKWAAAIAAEYARLASTEADQAETPR